MNKLEESREDRMGRRIAGRFFYAVGIALMVQQIGWATLWGVVLTLIGAVLIDNDFRIGAL